MPNRSYRLKDEFFESITIQEEKALADANKDKLKTAVTYALKGITLPDERLKDITYLHGGGYVPNHRDDLEKVNDILLEIKDRTYITKLFEMLRGELKINSYQLDKSFLADDKNRYLMDFYKEHSIPEEEKTILTGLVKRWVESEAEQDTSRKKLTHKTEEKKEETKSESKSSPLSLLSNAASLLNKEPKKEVPPVMNKDFSSTVNEAEKKAEEENNNKENENTEVDSVSSKELEKVKKDLEEYKTKYKELKAEYDTLIKNEKDALIELSKYPNMPKKLASRPNSNITINTLKKRENEIITDLGKNGKSLLNQKKYDDVMEQSLSIYLLASLMKKYGGEN